MRELPAEEDPHCVAEETSHLAPHGVPGGLPRVASNVKLEEGHVGAGGAGFNPFNEQQYFNR